MQSDQEYDSSLERSLQDFDEVGSYKSDSDENQQENESHDGSGYQEGQEGQQNVESDEEANVDKRNRKEKEQDDEQKKDHYKQYLKPDEEVDSEAPITVIVHGSKQSGKSSLIRSLVKCYTKHKVEQVNGTITLRSNKKQRLTLIQCPNDACAMIDLSKVADIVILLIDASLGFQMETFEFLSLLKSHGFPNVMGVLTHLDYFKENKQQRKTKKKFKKRFEYEVGGNYKLFNLEKWDNGLYEKIEVAKIARYLGTSKSPQFPFRQNHPFIIADRWQTYEDKGYSKDDEVDVSFYGYIRGSSYRMNGKIHVVGVGDYMIKSISAINDPCPEYKKEEKKVKQGEERQRLKGDMQVEGNSDDDEDDGIGNKAGGGTTGIASSTPIKRKRRTLNQQERIIYAPSCNLGSMHLDHTSGHITIPKDYVKFTKMNEEQDESQLQEGIKLMRNMQNLTQSINSRLEQRNEEFELLEGVGMQKENAEEMNMSKIEQVHGNKEFREKQKEIRALKKQTENIELVNPHLQGEDVHRKDDLHTLIYQSKEKMKTHDCSKYHPQGQFSQNLRSLFVTGMEGDILKEMQESDSQQADRQKRQISKVMNTDYTRASINESTNMYQKGQYVCVTLQKVNFGTFTHFSYSKPMILARINLGQDNYGFINVKFKRHRWYSNLLKSNDPIIVSSGWRRYQSMITFATMDQNQRMRFLKYTPKHDFCNAVFYGNFVQQNTGVVMTQTVRNDLKKFRIAGTGLVMQINKSFEIMKKIKLIGEPYKIMKNTAFVKGMFNSSMEVSNYIGAQIRTVSGIRGQVKKAVKDGGEGTFRATFEDKVSVSDIVFCRAWYKIILERYYNPIQTYQKKRIMKTKFELRMEKGIEIEKKPDSEYKTIDRAPKVFNPFMLPKKLEAKLPFKTADKLRQSKKDQIRRAESEKVPAILQSDKEREVASLIQRLNTIKNMKTAKQEQKFKEKNRLKIARQKPKQEYYDKLKKQQKSQKMASITRKKNQQARKRSKKQQDND